MLRSLRFCNFPLEKSGRVSRKENRRYPRIPVRFNVVCGVGSSTLRARAALLSGGGIFLEWPDAPPAGAEVSLRFRPAKHLSTIESKAVVRYHLTGKGVALEFTEIAPEARQIILRMVEQKKDDRRQFPRVRLATQVESRDHTMVTFSRDVSVGGMFVESASPLATGSLLTLRFNLDDRTNIVVKAVVTYQVKKFGMGVQFLDLNAENRKSIADYVSRNTVLPET